MATLYITEYQSLAAVNYGSAPLPRTTLASQTVGIAGSSAQSSAFNANTAFIRVHTDAICSVLIGANPTATTSTARLAANQTEYFGVNAGDSIAVISNS